MPLWLVLAVIYQVKHWVCDYPLQGRYQLRKFLPGWDFFLPLASHAGIHAIATWLITVWLVGWKVALGLALFDGVLHFLMDRIKASHKYLGRFKALNASEFAAATSQQIRSNTLFWWSLGFDQAFHHLTHYTIIWYCIVHR